MKTDKGSSTIPTTNNRNPAPWKYIEPKDLKTTITDMRGRNWKFCTKYKCRHTHQMGLYQLSHFDWEHDSSKVSKLSATHSAQAINSEPTLELPPEGNFASSNIDFLGAWCAVVDQSPQYEITQESNVSTDAEDTSYLHSQVDTTCNVALAHVAQVPFSIFFQKSQHIRLLLTQEHLLR